MKVVILVAMLCVGIVTPAAAQDTDVLSPEEAALLASRVQAEVCADVAASNPETQAAAMMLAAPAWGQVSAAYRTHGKAYLLYWRGLLAECLDKEDQAATDYAAFVDAMGSDSAYASQTKDARRRLRRLLPSTSGAQSSVGSEGSGLGPGIVLGGVGGATAVFGAGMHFASYATADFDANAGTYGGSTEDYQQTLGLNRAGFGLLVGGAAAAATGVIVAIASGSRRQAAAPRVGAAVLASRDGVVFVIGGEL